MPEPFFSVVLSLRQATMHPTIGVESRSEQQARRRSLCNRKPGWPAPSTPCCVCCTRYACRACCGLTCTSAARAPAPPCGPAHTNQPEVAGHRNSRGSQVRPLHTERRWHTAHTAVPHCAPIQNQQCQGEMGQTELTSSWRASASSTSSRIDLVCSASRAARASSAACQAKEKGHASSGRREEGKAEQQRFGPATLLSEPHAPPPQHASVQPD